MDNVLLKRISTVLLLTLLALSTVIVIYTRTYNYEEQRHHHVIHTMQMDNKAKPGVEDGDKQNLADLRVQDIQLQINATTHELMSKQKSWDDVEIRLKQCPDDVVLCGIDTNRSSVRDLMTTLNNNYFRHMFRRIDHNWSFDEDMADYGCEVHAFDPSIGMKDHLHNERVNFHNLGLWGSDIVNRRKWALNKLSTIRSQLGHQKRIIDVLKVDVETAEWPFLRNIVNEDQDQLDTVRQILLEVHSPRSRRQRVSKEDIIEMVSYAKGLKDLGFKVYLNRQFHNGCNHFAGYMPRGIRERCCQETYYVNSAYAESATRIANIGQI